MKETFPANIIMSLTAKQQKKLRWNKFFIISSAACLLLSLLVDMKRFVFPFLFSMVLSLNHGRIVKQDRYRTVFISVEDAPEYYSLIFENVGTIGGVPCSLVHEISKQHPMRLNYSEKKEELRIACVARSYYICDGDDEHLEEGVQEKIIFYLRKEDYCRLEKILKPAN